MKRDLQLIPIMSEAGLSSLSSIQSDFAPGWRQYSRKASIISTVESSSKYLILKAFGNAAFFTAHFLKAFIFNDLKI